MWIAVNKQWICQTVVISNILINPSKMQNIENEQCNLHALYLCHRWLYSEWIPHMRHFSNRRKFWIFYQPRIWIHKIWCSLMIDLTDTVVFRLQWKDFIPLPWCTDILPRCDGWFGWVRSHPPAICSRDTLPGECNQYCTSWYPGTRFNINI